MTKINYVLAVLLAGFCSSVAFAVKPSNPWMRVCRISEGLFDTVKYENTEYPLCWFQTAAVGAEVFFLFKTGGGTQQALQAYLEHAAEAPRNGCSPWGAKLIPAVSSTGKVVRLCQFSDGSFILDRTLNFGPGSPANQGLDQALN